MQREAIRERLDLNDAAAHLLDECRMVLPGIQALFGFQLIAVFNATFHDKLTPGLQQLHLGAIVLVSLAIALVMTPAALHRQAGAQEVTSGFIRASSRLLLAGMVPLAAGILADVYLIARLILHADGTALAVAAIVLAAFAFLWGILPRVHRLRQALES
jgi:hypothetical protein